MNSTVTRKLSPEEISALEGLRARMMPLRFTIEKLQENMVRNPAAPPSWPEIQRTIGVLNGHLHSLQQFINGYMGIVKVNDEEVENWIPGRHTLLRALHPYPQPPFPMEKAGMPGLVETLLRKRLDPKEQKWVDDSLRKAMEFCYVPGDWGIEPTKSGDARGGGAGDDDDDDGDDDEDRDSGVKGGNAEIKKVERRTGALNEDELMEMWQTASSQAMIAAAKVSDENEAGGSDFSGSEYSSPSAPEDAEMEDVKGEASRPSAGPSGSSLGSGVAGTGPGMQPQFTTLPLSAILKFMGTGATS
ncbi:hypothetical protein K504DRAFT_534072 [Pleomassaria siparia CBS 279.74]|uniref:Mediator complex subunit 8 n=1 Tax=Pleomassaria siparia CBS 279.74 TaxID=1314801 RepID=A0A6G1KBD6_9PLEO|nr:hypothetical protein K504DRAFT_534072 [Pleomassaria siparia CBS 279.74]